MITNLQTERLTLRPLMKEDAAGILLLDGDTAVLKYLPEEPLTDIEDALKKINYIQAQYEKNGIGRWAVVRRSDNAFLGWCGIKWVNDAVTNGRTDYYDVGYRFLPEHWAKGYAFEAAAACVHYAFHNMGVAEVHATVMAGNIASARIATKLDMHLAETFMEDGSHWLWYTLANPGGNK